MTNHLKNKLGLLGFLCLLFASVYGQTDSLPAVLDKLYLKDGSILVGKVLEYIPETEIKFQTAHGAILVMPMEKVKKVVQDTERNQKTRYLFKERGFYHSTSAGLIFNAVSAEQGGLTGFELSTVFGYQLNQYLGFGLGGSADFYHRSTGEMVFPIFLECRGYLIKKPISPYYTIRSGYGIAAKNEDLDIVGAKGGWMFNPAVGWRFGNGNKGVFTFDIGVKWQNASFEYRRNTEQSLVDLQYRRMNIRFGLLF